MWLKLKKMKRQVVLLKLLSILCIYPLQTTTFLNLSFFSFLSFLRLRERESLVEPREKDTPKDSQKVSDFIKKNIKLQSRFRYLTLDLLHIFNCIFNKERIEPSISKKIIGVLILFIKLYSSQQ